MTHAERLRLLVHTFGRGTAPALACEAGADALDRCAPVGAEPPSLVALVQEWQAAHAASLADDANYYPSDAVGNRYADAERNLLAWTPVQAEPPVCVCGHEQDEHGSDGLGHCGATKACRAGGCKVYRPATPSARPTPAAVPEQET